MSFPLSFSLRFGRIQFTPFQCDVPKHCYNQGKQMFRLAETRWTVLALGVSYSNERRRIHARMPFINVSVLKCRVYSRAAYNRINTVSWKTHKHIACGSNTKCMGTPASLITHWDDVLTSRMPPSHVYKPRLSQTLFAACPEKAESCPKRWQNPCKSVALE